ncbi:hypothetical protein [Jiella pelagia]|uniref:Uncharacterized protein n=1 Tax=Jiella pelagia TaxID=2986949 RepID=A0ABY7BTZ1_9HYPH|nr:hypothetical protein [Jiella pelagia]WAP67201.1 hypothetical protein OH818_16625 [Jiella pelagia]
MSSVQGARTQDLIRELIDRGFYVEDGRILLGDVPQPEIDRLAELIALGRTDEALAALHDIVPAAPRPGTIKHVLAARAAEPPRRIS